MGEDKKIELHPDARRLLEDLRTFESQLVAHYRDTSENNVKGQVLHLLLQITSTRGNLTQEW